MNIVEELKSECEMVGLRLFVADTTISRMSPYGFITDERGSRVLSWGVELGCVRFSGCYRAVEPGIGRQVGSGWMIEANTVKQAWEASQHPPHWATKGHKVTLANESDHLTCYQNSSHYKEVSA